MHIATPNSFSPLPSPNLPIHMETKHSVLSILSTQTSPLDRAASQASAAIPKDLAVARKTPEILKRAKPEDAAAPGRKHLTISTERGEVHVSIAERRAINLPPGSQAKFTAWLEANAAKLAQNDIGGHRIPYSKNDIGPALHAFQNDYHCSWAEMKHHCNDPKIMQIINDFRACALDGIFSQLWSEFGTLKEIGDFGSSKLTSDRDFAFSDIQGRQTRETEVVARFNAIFEREWHVPSAVVFDSNAYTMQYVMTAADPDMESQRSQFQNNSSLLMKLRNGTPESWQIFKKATLDKIVDPEKRQEKELQFADIEKQNSQIQLQLNKEIIRLATAGSDHAIDPRLLNDEEAINKMAAKIKAENPHIEIQASNGLHQAIKAGYKELEEQRINLFSGLMRLEALSDIGNVTEFAEVFNAKNKELIGNYQADLAIETDPEARFILEALIKNLEDNQINAEEAPAVMDAFHARCSIENDEKALKNLRRQLENDQNELEKLQAQAAKMQGQLDSTDMPAEDRVKLQTNHDKIQSKINATREQLGIPKDAAFAPAIAEKIVKADKQLQELANQREALFDELGQAWDKAGHLGVEGDRLLMHMQRKNIQGMFYAQEAHVSEGAFAFVVQNLQQGTHEVRTLNQYAQGFREITGFCSGHQAHFHTPHEQMTEASKYADRLVIATKVITERALSLGVTPPPFGADVGRLEIFFKPIAAIRGTGRSDAFVRSAVETAAHASGLVAPAEPFGETAVTSINAKIEGLAASLEAWLTDLPENARNAYYRSG